MLEADERMARQIFGGDNKKESFERE